MGNGSGRANGKIGENWGAKIGKIGPKKLRQKLGKNWGKNWGEKNWDGPKAPG